MKRFSITKGMSKFKINSIVGEYILLEDEEFKGNAYKHNWKCKCGKIFKREWRVIRDNNSTNCGCLIYNLQEHNYKHAVEKNGKYEYIKSFRKGDLMDDGRIVKHIAYLKVKHLYCGSIFNAPASTFVNKDPECLKCCNEYENSLAYHIQHELKEPLNKYWDWEKNAVNPYCIYKSSRNKVFIKCTETDYHDSYDIMSYMFVKGQRCGYCYNRKIHPKDSFGALYPEKAKYWSNKNKENPYDVAPKSGKKFKFHCDECNCEWDTTLSNMYYGCWCPHCQMSKGEKKIKIFLNDNNIKYIYDDTFFNDLIGVGGVQLRPDFILPEYKIWIEYDGEFHYKEIYENDGHETLKIHDKLKDEYAKSNGWDLIRIPYWSFDDIVTVLTNKLKL